MVDNNKPRKGSKKKLFEFKKVKKVAEPSDDNKVKDGKSKTDEKSDKKKKKLGWKIFKICLFVGLALCIIGTGIVLGVITGIIDKTKTIDLEELAMLKLTTFIYSSDEKEIGHIYYDENRVNIEYKDIPQHVIDAVTSIEDERFFTHNGVDIKRTGAAIFTFVINGGKSDFGGSTITQQLVKKTTDDDSKSWVRKIREWYRAITLEKKLSKEQIFESYINTIYLGDGSYGMEVAAKNYFGKSLKDVNIAEAAVLASLVQLPEVYNPYKGDSAKEKLFNRQQIVLSQMLKLNKITKEQYEEAKNTKIEFNRSEIAKSDNVQSYFVDAVIEQVIADLMKTKNIERKVAENMVLTRGYKIYTTQNIDVQKAIDDAYNNDKLFYKDADGGFMQSAMVVMDQSNGSVVGLIGGADEKTENRTWNRATQTKKQPGSTMKPLGAYGPAFELGISYPAMGVDDSPIDLPDYNPKNYYKGFNGYVTVRNAVAQSMNLPAVRTTMKVGLDYSYNFAKNLGLVSLRQEDKTVASLALGGIDKGLTILEMANAYATIANGGLHIEPKLYTKVLDNEGKEVLVKETSPKRVMKDTTSYLLTDVLRSVVTSGTGTSVKVGNMPIAGKTGNTNNDYDQWFIGYSPYYTIACWNGYDKNKTIGTRKSGSYPYTAVKLFNTVMNSISKGQEVKQFEKPNGIVHASVCKVSGLVPTDACKNDPRGSQVITDIFATGTVPTATCNIHKMVRVCKVTGLLANDNDAHETEERSFITRDYVPSVKPADWKYMVPTEKCTAVKEPEKPTTPTNPDDVNIYGENKKPKT